MQNNRQSDQQNGRLSKEEREELVKNLTPLQFRVTQHKITERPFTGEYLKVNDKGLYCCVVCGEEIFSSTNKYDSGCGWPAFDDVLNNSKVKLHADVSHVGSNLLLLALKQDLARTEVSCARCGSHLGHVFNDGPKTTGKRYCINSASLKFLNNKESKTNGQTKGQTNGQTNGHKNFDIIDGTNDRMRQISTNYCNNNKNNNEIKAKKSSLRLTHNKTLMETHL